ncbi:hypothetical protein ACHQM5_015325 [Ranunculus cassubicifolius]
MESRVKSSKRLIFDRRYGWVVDEWKEPSEEALSGARGMFSILPLANAFVKFASQSSLDKILISVNCINLRDAAVLDFSFYFFTERDESSSFFLLVFPSLGHVEP